MHFALLFRQFLGLQQLCSRRDQRLEGHGSTGALVDRDDVVQVVDRLVEGRLEPGTKHGLGSLGATLGEGRGGREERLEPGGVGRKGTNVGRTASSSAGLAVLVVEGLGAQLGPHRRRQARLQLLRDIRPALLSSFLRHRQRTTWKVEWSGFSIRLSA